MTGFAVDYRADRVCVAGDSLMYLDGGTPIGLTSKVNALPKLRCVLFATGKVELQVGAYAALLSDPQILSFEDAAAVLPDLLIRATDEYDQWPEDDPAKDVIRLLLMGWSAAEGRMRCAQFNSSDRYVPHLEFDRRYQGPLPWPGLPPEALPLDRSTDKLETKLVGLINAIDDYCIANPAWAHNSRLGGNIDLVTLTEKEIERRVIGHIPCVFHEEEEPETKIAKAILPTSAEVIPLSRQQRRLLQRKGRL